MLETRGSLSKIERAHLELLGHFVGLGSIKYHFDGIILTFGNGFKIHIDIAIYILVHICQETIQRGEIIETTLKRHDGRL